MNQIIEKIAKNVIPQRVHELNSTYKNNVIAGYQVYSDLLNKYGFNRKIKVLYTGTGDAYIAASYYKNYIISKGEKNTALLVVGSQSVKNLLLLFGIEDAYVLKPRQILEIIKFYVYIGENINIEILHPHIFFRHTGFLAYMEGIKPEMNFAYMMKHIVFENVLHYMPINPSFQTDIKYVHHLQKEKGIEKNNTVLLIPYSTTIKSLPLGFWKRLIADLKKHNFLVFVNSDEAANKLNLPVESLFLPYPYIVPVLDYFHFFVIGMRCGLFDVIHTAQCHMTALYNREEKRGCAKTANLLASFSLSGMYGNDRVNEYLIDEANMAQITELIIRKICAEREMNKTALGEVEV